MAAVRPGSSPPTRSVDPNADSSECSTFGRGLPGDRCDDEPTTLARAPSRCGGEVWREPDPLEARPSPIIENDGATPIVDRPIVEKDVATPIIENDVATLMKAARELDPDTLPRQTREAGDSDAGENTAATLVRRDSILPPAPRPSLPSPAMASTGAIRTPLAMVMPPEDNLTRVAPLTAPPLVRQPPRTPSPFSEPAGAHKLALRLSAFAGAGLLFVAIALAMVAVRPRMKGAAAAQGPEATAVAVTAVEAPPPVSPFIAVPPPPVAAATATARPPASTTTTRLAPPTTIRSQPRHRHAPPRVIGRGAARPSVPSRREP